MKKKKIKLKIEDEFKFYKIDHKIRTIQCVHELFNEKVIYTPRLAKEFRNLAGETFEEKDYNLINLLYEDEERANRLYDYCWDKTKFVIDDKTVFSKDIYEALRKEFIIE